MIRNFLKNAESDENKKISAGDCQSITHYLRSRVTNCNIVETVSLAANKWEKTKRKKNSTSIRDTEYQWAG